MRIYTRCLWDMTYNPPLLVAVNSYLTLKNPALLKGPSAQQQQLAASQQQFYNTLTANYNQQFANQQAIFNAIKSVYDPIFKAGPSQYGFSASEDQALRTQAGEGTAANYDMAVKGAAERIAAGGGGNSFLPSGVQADIQGKIASEAAGDISSKQLDITKAGYDVGRQNFLQASNAEMGVAAGYNPLGYAGAADSAGTSAFNMATKVQEMKNAASPWGAVGGLLGGVVGSFLGPIGTAVGSKVGGFLGNAGSGNASAGMFGGALAGGGVSGIDAAEASDWTS